MNKIKIILNGPILLVVSILLGVIVLPIGFLYSLGKSIYRSNIKIFFQKIFNLLLEILFVISWICGRIAIGIDILGNVMLGELIEDCVTSKEETLYGKHGITLSAATGDLELKNNLNKTGKWFTNTLSEIFEKNHCILAYKYYKMNIKLMEETKYLREDDDYSWNT